MAITYNIKIKRYLTLKMKKKQKNQSNVYMLKFMKTTDRKVLKKIPRKSNIVIFNSHSVQQTKQQTKKLQKNSNEAFIKLFYMRGRKGRHIKFKKLLKFAYLSGRFNTKGISENITTSYYRIQLLKHFKFKKYFKSVRYRRNRHFLQTGRRRRVLKKLRQLKKTSNKILNTNKIFNKYLKKKILNPLYVKRKNLAQLFSNTIYLTKVRSFVIENENFLLSSVEYQNTYNMRIDYFLKNVRKVNNDLKNKLNIQSTLDLRKKLANILIRFDEIYKRLSILLRKIFKTTFRGLRARYRNSNVIKKVAKKKIALKTLHKNQQRQNKFFFKHNHFVTLAQEGKFLKKKYKRFVIPYVKALVKVTLLQASRFRFKKISNLKKFKHFKELKAIDFKKRKNIKKYKKIKGRSFRIKFRKFNSKQKFILYPSKSQKKRNLRRRLKIKKFKRKNYIKTLLKYKKAKQYTKQSKFFLKKRKWRQSIYRKTYKQKYLYKCLKIKNKILNSMFFNNLQKIQTLVNIYINTPVAYTKFKLKKINLLKLQKRLQKRLLNENSKQKFSLLNVYSLLRKSFKRKKLTIWCYKPKVKTSNSKLLKMIQLVNNSVNNLCMVDLIRLRTFENKANDLKMASNSGINNFYLRQILDHVIQGRQYVKNKYAYEVNFNISSKRGAQQQLTSKNIIKRIEAHFKKRNLNKNRYSKNFLYKKYANITTLKYPLLKMRGIKLNKIYDRQLLLANRNTPVFLDYLKNKLDSTLNLKNYIINKLNITQFEIFKFILYYLKNIYEVNLNLENGLVENSENFLTLQNLNLNNGYTQMYGTINLSYYMIKNMLQLKQYNKALYKRFSLNNVKRVIYKIIYKGKGVCNIMYLPKKKYEYLNGSSYMQVIKSYYKKLKIINNLTKYLKGVLKGKMTYKNRKFKKMSKRMYMKLSKIKASLKNFKIKNILSKLLKLKYKYLKPYKKILRLFKYKFKKIKSNIVPNYRTFSMKRRWIYKNIRRYVKKSKKLILKLYKKKIKKKLKGILVKLVKSVSKSQFLLNLTYKKKLKKCQKILYKNYTNYKKKLKYKWIKAVKVLLKRKKQKVVLLKRILLVRYKELLQRYKQYNQNKLTYLLKSYYQIRVRLKKQILKKILINKIKRKLNYFIKKKVLKYVRKEIRKVYTQRMLIRVADNGIPKVGLLAIKIGKRNMYISILNQKTNHLITTISARKSYVQMKQIEKKRDTLESARMENSNTSENMKLRAGAEIKNAQFRKHLIFEILFKIYNLKYRMLNIRYAQKYKQKELKSILKVPEKYAGIIRNVEIHKQKPHGYMRKKKLRRL